MHLREVRHPTIERHSDSNRQPPQSNGCTGNALMKEIAVGAQAFKAAFIEAAAIARSVLNNACTACSATRCGGQALSRYPMQSRIAFIECQALNTLQMRARMSPIGPQAYVRRGDLSVPLQRKGGPTAGGSGFPLVTRSYDAIASAVVPKRCRNLRF